MAVKEDNSNVTFDVIELVEEIEPNLFHSQVDIHDYPFTNRLDLYALGEKGERALFIDVGLDDLCGTDVLNGLLDKLDLNFEDAAVFITHFHDDHDGNLAYCINQGVQKIYHNRYKPFSPERLQTFMTATGINRAQDFDLKETAEFLMNKDRIPLEIQAKMVEVTDGATFDIGGYHLEVIATPGHTPEHSSLLDRDKGILFAGDHLLDSSPGLLQLDPDSHLLRDYLQSLEMIKALNLEVAYMSHTDSLFGTEAISEFIDHVIAKYDRPLSQIRELVANSEGETVYEFARKYYSYLKGGLEGQIDKMRLRRIAIMLGFLDYLYDVGEIDRHEAEDGAFIYSPKNI